MEQAAGRGEAEGIRRGAEVAASFSLKDNMLIETIILISSKSF